MTNRWHQTNIKELKKSFTEDDGSLHGKINWEKVLGEYGKHKQAYKEHMNDVSIMNPYVFVWSETENMPMPNPTVSPNDLETWNEAKKQATNSKAHIIRFEKTFDIPSSSGRIVTSHSLAKLAPAGTTPAALAAALGATADDHHAANESMELLMAKYVQNARLGKSKSWWGDLEKLRKDAPFAGEHQTGPVRSTGESKTNRWGSGEKGGMRIRWDAAHNYMKPVVVQGKWDDLHSDDQAAITFAHTMSDKMDDLNTLQNDGKEHEWLVHTFLRPHQQRFFVQGLYQYKKHHENAASDRNSRWSPPARARALNRARQHMAQVERERLKIVLGEYKPFKLTDRYKHNKVQPGTIAARHILEGRDGHHAENEIDVESKVMIPQQGQHGPTSYDQHDNEVERQRVPRAAPGMSGSEFVNESHSVAGIEMGDIFAAMKQAKLQRQQPRFRGNPPWSARQAKRVNAGLPRVSSLQWKDWKSWDRKKGETEDVFLTRKLAEFFMLKEGRPNPSSWRTVFADFMNGELSTENGPIFVTNKMRHDFNRAAARIAVNNSVISREEEWDALPFKIKFKYRSKVMHEIHKNAFDTQYGQEHERRFAAERLRRHKTRQNVPNLFTANGPIRNRALRAGGAASVGQLRRQPRSARAAPGVVQAAAQPTVDVQQPDEAVANAKNIEAKVMQINKQIANLARFYIKNKKIKLGAEKAIQAAEQLMAANRLYAQRMKRYQSAGASISPRQQENIARAQAEIESARQQAQVVFGRDFENEVKRALARKRSIAAKRRQLMKLNRSWSANSSMGAIKRLRSGLAKAMVAHWGSNITVQ